MASTNKTRQSLKAATASERAAPTAAGPGRVVRQFRQILLWPLQLMRCDRGAKTDNWDLLAAIIGAADSHWTETSDALPDDPGLLQEHAYREFVSFLPHV